MDSDRQERDVHREIVETQVKAQLQERAGPTVDRPGGSHYGGEANPHEPIKVIEHYGLGFNVGNAIKYALRAGSKPGVLPWDDLRKAAWYLGREADNLEREASVDIRTALEHAGIPVTRNVDEALRKGADARSRR